MLQRSPTYIASLPDSGPVRRAGQQVAAGEGRLRGCNRWKAIAWQHVQYQLARRFPNFFRKALRTMAERRLPEGFDFDKHFSPRYKPWDQRVCVAPNGDLFKAIRAGTADVVTDTIERFTKTGIKLSSGDELRGRHHRHRNGIEHAVVRRRGDPRATASRSS